MGKDGWLAMVEDTAAVTRWAKGGAPELPVHFISGGKDPCRISDKALESAVEAMRQKGYRRVSLKIYPGLRHEIHNETEHQQVWDDILSELVVGADRV